MIRVELLEYISFISGIEIHTNADNLALSPQPYFCAFGLLGNLFISL